MLSVKPPKPNIQSKPHSIERENDLLTIKHDTILNPAKQSLQTLTVNNNLISPSIIISTELQSIIRQQIKKFLFLINCKHGRSEIKLHM